MRLANVCDCLTFKGKCGPQLFVLEKIVGHKCVAYATQKFTPSRDLQTINKLLKFAALLNIIIKF